MSLTTILFLGSAQAAFLVALIAAKRKKGLPDGILTAWLVVLGLHHLVQGLHLGGTDLAPTLLNLNAGVPLLQGPFLFLYVDSLTSGRRRPRPVDALHLVPFLAFAAQVTLFLPRVAPSHSSVISVFRLTGWVTVAILASVPIYALLALRKLRRHDAEVLQRHSERTGRDLAWLRRIVLALLALWAVVLGVGLAPSPMRSGVRHWLMGSVTLFIYAIGYLGWRQFAVVEPEEVPADDRGDPADGGSAKDSAKYERSGLKEDEIDDLVAALREYLDDERPYLEPGVTLAEIADGLETTPNRLSQAINQGMGKNFHELINERRVADFEERALAPENRHRTLLAIAFDSGFSSKSSFNRVVKQLTGRSPRQHLAARTRTDDDAPS